MAENAEDKTVKVDGQDGAKLPEVNYEELARGKGWKSKEELGADFDPVRYVGAEEFVKREPLFETLRDLKRQNKELKMTVESVVKFSKQNAELAAKKAIAELNAQKKEAIKLGDVDTVDTIDQTIKEHEKVVQESAKVPVANEMPDEIVKWTESNEWFNDDIEMQEFAIAKTSAYMKRNPGASMEKALAETTKAVKLAFPDSKWFKTRRQDPSPVEGHRGDGERKTAGNKKYTLDRLDDEQRRCHDAYVRQGVMSSEEYFKSLEEIGALA